MKRTLQEQEPKKKLMINGITIGKLFQYFVVYSFFGFVIETLFAIIVYGTVESRRSVLYGPFCCIYGLGAVIMIPALNKLKKNNISLFIGGFIVGSIVEYAISYIGELIFHIKWWDYSSMALNINGRVCVAFSFFWGILAVILMTYINPRVDKLLDKIPSKYVTIITTIAFIALCVDSFITGVGLQIFLTRTVNEYDLQVQNSEKYMIEDTSWYYSEIIQFMIAGRPGLSVIWDVSFLKSMAIISIISEIKRNFLDMKLRE